MSECIDPPAIGQTIILSVHDVHASCKLPKREGDTFTRTNQPGTYKALMTDGILWWGNMFSAERIG